MVNWSAIAAVISGITLLLVLLGGAHLSGKLVEKINDHTLRLDKHEILIDEHDDHLQKIDIALVKIERYQEGFSDATKIMEKNHAESTGT